MMTAGDNLRRDDTIIEFACGVSFLVVWLLVGWLIERLIGWSGCDCSMCTIIELQVLFNRFCLKFRQILDIASRCDKIVA